MSFLVKSGSSFERGGAGFHVTSQVVFLVRPSPKHAQIFPQPRQAAARSLVRPTTHPFFFRRLSGERTGTPATLEKDARSLSSSLAGASERAKVSRKRRSPRPFSLFASRVLTRPWQRGRGGAAVSPPSSLSSRWRWCWWCWRGAEAHSTWTPSGRRCTTARRAATSASRWTSSKPPTTNSKKDEPSRHIDTKTNSRFRSVDLTRAGE